MRLHIILTALAGSLFFSGCYTQLETVERERPAPQRTMVSQDAYDSYYEIDPYLAYEEGYYDGVFDAQLGFRHYDHRRHNVSLSFHWGRPFMGYGYSYGYFYDPYWHYWQLYDPFWYSYYGYYGFRYHHRFHRFAHFHRPWGFVGYGNFIVFVLPSSSSSTVQRGPRASGVHRGTVANTRGNRVSSSGNLANRGDRSRVDGTTRSTAQQRSDIRTRSTLIGGGRTDVRGGSDRGNQGSVDRRRATPPQRVQPPQRRGNDRGNVNRNRGGNNQGNVNRTRGNNRSSGSVNRGGNSNRSSGNVNRSRGGNNTQAAPQRSRSSSNSSGNRNRGGDGEVSMINTPDIRFDGITYTISA